MSYTIVFIDTNALPRGLNKLSSEIERLAELAEFELICVYISWVSVNEWRTQMVHSYLKKMESLSNSVDDILKQPVSLGLPQHEKLIDLQHAKLDIYQDATRLIEERVDGVFKHLKIKIVDIGRDDGKEVMARYFDGRPPFSSPKNRKDIPDAFIYRAAQHLCHHNVSTVHGVCNDEGLRSALSNLQNFIVHKDLKTLLASDALTKASARLPIAKFWSKPERDKIVTALRSHTEFFYDEIKLWINAELPQCHIQDDSIPEDNHEALVTSIGGVDSIHINWEKAESLGPGSGRLRHTG